MDATPLKIAAAALAPIGLFVCYEVGKVVIPPYFSPLRRLPGPPSPSFLFGHLKDVFFDSEDTGVPFEEWMKIYGQTFVFKDAMNQNRLFTTDLKAIQHWMTHSYLYQKSEDSHHLLGQVVGEGLLVVEMDQHKRQRRVMNPAFGPLQLRNLSGIFTVKSQELRDVILTQLSSSSQTNVIVDVMDMLSKATLDMIGLAGFNYRFDALSTQGDSPNELNVAIHDIFSEANSFSAMDILASWFPFLRIIPTRRKGVISRGRAVMERVGRQMIAEKKAAVLASGPDVDKASLKDRDILSLLVRSNLAADLPESQRLSDDEILWQIPTFLAAGHETTSTATTWALHALSLDQDVQTRLREELRTLSLPQTFDEEPLDEETLNALNALPLLDAVVRETLRYWAPVSILGRGATQDDVIPLSTPVTDRYGVVHDSLRIAKGDAIWTPVLPLHRSKEIWGEDADQFNPDRWLRENLRSMAGDMPGVWSYLLSFSGGPHACIGYRFAILEMKFLLHALVSTFVFRPAVENDVVRKSFIVDRPFLKSQPEKGSQLPLIVERA